MIEISTLLVESGDASPYFKLGMETDQVSHVLFRILVGRQVQNPCIPKYDM